MVFFPRAVYPISWLIVRTLAQKCFGWFRKRGSGFKGLLKPAAESFQCDAQDLADFSKLQYVEAALPSFVLADERLWFTDELGKIGLAQTRLFSNLSKELLELFLLARVDALLHSESIHNEA
jgi:hypothetical protein